MLMCLGVLVHNTAQFTFLSLCTFVTVLLFPMKKYTAFAIILIIQIYVAPLTYAAFPDVSSSHANADAIEYVQAQGIVSGYPDGTYKPAELVNRAEFMKIVIGAMREDTVVGSNCFPDVQNEWFAKYVCYGKAKGIVSGYPDGTFKPAQTVSFVEAAKMIANALELQMTEDTPWYKPYVVALESDQAIPLSITRFDQQLSRGEMAEIIYRLHAHITSKASRTYAQLAQDQMDDYTPHADICPPPDVQSHDVCRPSPTCVNVSYGDNNVDDSQYSPLDDRNVMDIWLADSASPTPAIIFIHGGGFSMGSKEDIYNHCYAQQNTSFIQIFLDANITVVSINYRLINGDNQWAYTREWYDRFMYPAPMLDAAQALVFLREHAGDYNIDPNRIALTGTSAGGGISFWLGFHDNILGKQTRPNCIGPWRAQSTYDLRVWNELMPGSHRTGHMLNFYYIEKRGFDLSGADKYDVLFREASPITHVTADDPPVFMYYTQPLVNKQGNIRGAHNPIFGQYAETSLQELNIPYELHFPEHDGFREYEAANQMKDFFFKHCF